jgi:hypothetical protein
MKERPIIFSGPMVRALLDGSKTQTRRVMKPQLVYGTVAGLFNSWYLPSGQGGGTLYPNGKEKILGTCPYGQPGDRLWVRESFCKIIGQSGGWIETDYQATYTHGFRLGDSLGLKKRWTPSIHMPRAASRITLEITSVRVERLQDISEADAQAEGVTDDGSLVTDLDGKDRGGAIAAYATLWEVINGVGSWDDNPWVWVVSFKRAFP